MSSFEMSLVTTTRSLRPRMVRATSTRLASSPSARPAARTAASGERPRALLRMAFRRSGTARLPTLRTFPFRPTATFTIPL